MQPNNPAQGGTGNPASFEALKNSARRKLLETIDLAEAEKLPKEQLRAECAKRVEALLRAEGAPLSSTDKDRLITQVIDDIFGLGPLEDILRAGDISDILINNARQIYVERKGRLELFQSGFRDDDHLIQVIQRIASAVGRRIDESSPMLDARLADGSRVNAIIPPLALDGPCMSIRRFGATPFDVSRLVGLGSVTPEMMDFLRAAVGSACNIVISGGTGSGKTTFLNVLSRCIPEGERVVTIEDAAELRLQREHVVRLETRPANIEGKGLITQRDLVKNALRMRPDRVIIGEIRGGEALDMLQAMNTGHDGSMTTVHANNTRDAVRRLENLVSLAGLNYPVHVIRQQIASAIQLIVQVGRITGGRRKVLAITEITGMESEVVLTQDLFTFKQTGVDSEGHATGHFEVCGVRPKIIERLRSEGYSMPDDLFQRRNIPVRLDPQPGSAPAAGAPAGGAPAGGAPAAGAPMGGAGGAPAPKPAAPSGRSSIAEKFHRKAG